jgi:hypothetical protein
MPVLDAGALMLMLMLMLAMVLMLVLLLMLTLGLTPMLAMVLVLILVLVFWLPASSCRLPLLYHCHTITPTLPAHRVLEFVPIER